MSITVEHDHSHSQDYCIEGCPAWPYPVATCGAERDFGSGVVITCGRKPHARGEHVYTDEQGRRTWWRE